MSSTHPKSPPTLVKFLWSERKRFAPGLAFAFGRILSIAALPLIFRRIVDHDMATKDIAGIATMSAITIALLFVHQWFSVRGAARLGNAVTRATLDLRARIFDKIGDLSFTYLDRQKTGKLLAKYAFDTQKIEGVAMPILNGFLPNSLYSILTVAILISMNWQLCGAVLLMMPILAIMRQRYFEPMRIKNEATRLAQERLTGTATEYLNAIRLVRSYGKEDRAGDDLAEADRAVARTRTELIALSMSFGAFTFASIQFLSLFVIAGGALLSIYGQVTPGTVLAFVAALPALVQPIQAFAGVADQMFVGGEAYRSIRELMDEADTEPWRGTKTLSPIRGRIEFDKVTFRYPGAERDAVGGLTLTIEPGERVALVGASGAGKSTIASLLLGLYPGRSGEVRIDGVPQRDLDVGWLRRQVGVVMQESILLSGTIAENLRFGRADATDEQVRDAARRANADGFIEALPSGYQTVVGERGATLSGGQRQRIAIARALLRDPTILILDEPTSALDYESERLIQKALDTLARGRTTVTIAHRLSTIRNADRIVVLDAGKVVEQGTYDQLRASGIHFRRLLKSASESPDTNAA